MPATSPDMLTRRVETTLRAFFTRALPGTHVYAAHSADEKLMPCVVIAARKTGDDMAWRYNGRYAATITLSAHCLVHASTPACDSVVTGLAESVTEAIQSATADDVPGFAIFHLTEPSEDSTTAESVREVALSWTLTAALI